MPHEEIKKDEEKSLENLLEDFRFTMELIGMRRETFSSLLESLQQKQDPADYVNLSRELLIEIQNVEKLAKHAHLLAQKILQKNIQS